MDEPDYYVATVRVSNSLDGLVLWKRYFARVWICAKWDFGRMPKNTERDLLDLVDSVEDFLKDTISMGVSIFRLVFRLPLTVWRCFMIPIMHGSKVEEKLTENS